MTAAREFADELAHGRVFYWVDCDQLDDPERDLRNKYGVILNTVYPCDDLYYILTTSKTERYQRYAVVRDNSLYVVANTYPFWREDTVISAHNHPTTIATMDLKRVYDAGRLRFVGTLSEAHRGELITIFRESPYIRRDILRFIVPWE